MLILWERDQKILRGGVGIFREFWWSQKQPNAGKTIYRRDHQCQHYILVTMGTQASVSVNSCAKV